jgi:hypothetical protein
MPEWYRTRDQDRGRLMVRELKGGAIIERIQRLKPNSVTSADWFARGACITIWHEQP